ncbi:MAG: serpin family protein [bacterium]|nr:serpin family protein [bacterium]
MGFLPSWLVAFLVVPQDDPAIANAKPVNASFACELYAQLAEREGNLFLSPYSISAALAMTLEGAAGETAAQMETVLHLERSAAAETFRALDAALAPPRVKDVDKEVDAYQLRVANAVWAQAGFEYRPQYSDVLRSAYRAHFADVDFRNGDRARAKINAWVAKQTERKIEELIPAGYLAPDTRLVLTNAIYFKSAWENAFSPNSTRPAPFTTLSGERSDVPMMNRSASYRLAKGRDEQVLELAYRGGHLSMWVVLPKEADGLPALEKRLSPEQLARWDAALEKKVVDVQLPRFRFSCQAELSRPLTAAGMTAAFDASKADFSGITASDRLFLSAVVHEAHVAVDEEGTEAAAATAVVMRSVSLPPRATEQFVADHPFLFLIRHRQSGALLFLGRVVEATE